MLQYNFIVRKGWLNRFTRSVSEGNLLKKKKGFFWWFFTVLSVTVIILGCIAATVGYLAFVPAKSNYIAPGETGVGIVSVDGNGYSWMKDSIETNLLAAAISRGKRDDSGRFSEKIVVFEFLNSDGLKENIILVRDPADKSFAFIDGNGAVRTHIQKYLMWLLPIDEIDSAINKSAPDNIFVNGNAVSASNFRITGKSIADRELVYTSGDVPTVTEKLLFRENVLNISGTSPESRVEIARASDGSVVFEGAVSDISGFSPESHIEYLISVVSSKDDDYSEYKISIVFEIEPIFHVSPLDLKTGDSIVVRIEDVREGDDFGVNLPFSYTANFKQTDSEAIALIPINHAFEPGQHKMTLYCRGYEKEFEFNVNAVEYQEQHLTITGEGAAANTAESSKEYADTMYPLFLSFDEEIYWEGLFIWPADGSITTDYGLYRYTNGSEIPTRHAGIDIANAEGTDIIAPNRGKVLYSGFLTLSGNTILIEHGMGLHTLYMHMLDRTVEAGDIVEKGQLIGHMGTTGYSTGPHLHYQMMILDYSISPWYSLDGTAGFYQIK